MNKTMLGLSAAIGMMVAGTAAQAASMREVSDAPAARVEQAQYYPYYAPRPPPPPPPRYGYGYDGYYRRHHYGDGDFYRERYYRHHYNDYYRRW